jgi:HK97 family phage major capsid protein
MEMTKTELATFLQEQTVPLIKQHVEGSVAKLIEDSIAKRIDALKQPVGDPLAAVTAVVKPIEREKGLAFARVLRALARSKFEGNGADAAPNYLKAWGDVDLADQLIDSRQKAMAAGVATAGGYLVPQQYASEIIDVLRARTVMRRMGVPTMQMATGTFNIPKITTGSTGYYIGENTNITKSELKTGNLQLTFKKLAALVPVSNDLLRYSQPSADTIIRNDVVRALQSREDQAFIRDDGMAGTPKGVRYALDAATNKLTVTAGGVSLANATTDLGRLILLLQNANIPLTRGGWLLAPRSLHYLSTVQNTSGFFVFRDEILRGTLWGFPYATTTTIPLTLTDNGGTDESEVYFGDFDEAIIGESANLIVDASQEAAYYDGSSVVAAYSQDQTVVRAIMEHDFALRRDTSFGVLVGVRWGV